MTTIVRYLISDVDDSNYKFTDSRIQTSILVAVTFVIKVLILVMIIRLI